MSTSTLPEHLDVRARQFGAARSHWNALVDPGVLSELCAVAATVARKYAPLDPDHGIGSLVTLAGKLADSAFGRSDCTHEWTGDPPLILTDAEGHRTIGASRDHSCTLDAAHADRGQPHECCCGATTTAADDEEASTR